MATERRIVVHQIDKETPLVRRIPLHMTLLHWFESNAPRDEMLDSLERFATNSQPVDTWATDADMFGHERNVHVMRIGLSEGLMGLHLGLLALADNAESQLDRGWVGAGKWSPHVTHQGDKRLFSGDRVKVDDLDFIAARPDGSRELIARIALGGTKIKR